MSINLGPYSNFHDMNLDWLITEWYRTKEALIGDQHQWEEFKENMNKAWNDYKTAVDGRITSFESETNANIDERFQTIIKSNESYQKAINAKVDANTTAVEDLKKYVNNYFSNLNVQTEINNKIDSMIADGTFLDVIHDQMSATVQKWLDAHITQPTVPAVDNTLSFSGACADSATVGKFAMLDRVGLTGSPVSLDNLSTGVYYLTKEVISANFSNVLAGDRNVLVVFKSVAFSGQSLYCYSNDNTVHIYDRFNVSLTGNFVSSAWIERGYLDSGLTNFVNGVVSSAQFRANGMVVRPSIINGYNYDNYNPDNMVNAGVYYVSGNWVFEKVKPKGINSAEDIEDSVILVMPTNSANELIQIVFINYDVTKTAYIDVYYRQKIKNINTEQVTWNQWIDINTKVMSEITNVKTSCYTSHASGTYGKGELDHVLTAGTYSVDATEFTDNLASAKYGFCTVTPIKNGTVIYQNVTLIDTTFGTEAHVIRGYSNGTWSVWSDI